MKQAIVIGASSGIGKELVQQLVKKGYRLAIAARRLVLLQELEAEFKGKIRAYRMDLLEIESAMKIFKQMLAELGQVDLIVLNAGIGGRDIDLGYATTRQTIGVNVIGFTALANISYNYLKKQKTGTLMGISSIASMRGNGYAPVYSASKAFVSNYLEGLRCKAFNDQVDLTIIDIKPGFVDTDLIKNMKQKFWVETTEKVVKQILTGVAKKKPVMVVTKRWYWIGWVMKHTPSWIYKRVISKRK